LLSAEIAVEKSADPALALGDHKTSFLQKSISAPDKTQERFFNAEPSASVSVWCFGHFSPDYSQCVGVKIEKACLIGALFQVCGFDSSPTM
jgi:hypothetical protein